LSLRDDILQEQRELLLEGLKPLLENDEEIMGDSPLAPIGISTDDIWSSILGLATAKEKVFVTRVLELVHHIIITDPIQEWPHTRWVLSYMRGWVKALKTAGEIEKTDDFNIYYGLHDFHIGLCD